MALWSNAKACFAVIPAQVRAIPEGVQAMAVRSLRVAILDDDPSVRVAISRLLNASSMIGDSFATSIDLFNAMETARPDCILVDLYMPTLDGLEVMSYLRQIGVTAPVIIITAHDDPTLRDRCLRAGATAYLRKPLEAAELLDSITRSARPPTI
jgi:FixJ family two-component response regulator